MAARSSAAEARFSAKDRFSGADRSLPVDRFAEEDYHALAIPIEKAGPLVLYAVRTAVGEQVLPVVFAGAANRSALLVSLAVPASPVEYRCYRRHVVYL